MRHTILTAFFCSICLSVVSAQDSSTLDVHLFTEEMKEAAFRYKYVVDAEGENTVDKTIFENTIRLLKVSVSEDTVVLRIRADSTQVSNVSSIKDGEVAMLYAMIGLNMELKCNAKGQLLEVLNKDEIIAEFTNGIEGMSNESREMLVQNMLEENEAMFFDKAYEMNYASLLKYLNKDLSLPYESNRDTLIEETPLIPASTMKTIEKNTKQEDKATFLTNITQEMGEFTQLESTYEMITKPAILNTKRLLETDEEGLVQRLSTTTEIKREGMIMKRNGKVMNEMMAFTQFITMEYIRVQ